MPIINNFNLTPLNSEDFEKIQKEIKENINKVKEKNNFLDIKIEELLQNEENSKIFYKNLSNFLKNSDDIKDLQNISKECSDQIKFLENLYFSKNNKTFKPKKVQIIKIPSLKKGLILAINEELNSYEIFLQILDKNIDLNIKNELNKMCFYKLKRIAKLQFLLLKYII